MENPCTKFAMTTMGYRKWHQDLYKLVNYHKCPPLFSDLFFFKCPWGQYGITWYLLTRMQQALKLGNVELALYQLLTSVFPNSSSLSEHQPVQKHQNLQLYSFQDCGRKYSRISTSSARYNSALCRSGFLLIAYLIVRVPSSQHNSPNITAAFEQLSQYRNMQCMQKLLLLLSGFHKTRTNLDCNQTVLIFTRKQTIL